MRDIIREASSRPYEVWEGETDGINFKLLTLREFYQIKRDMHI